MKRLIVLFIVAATIVSCKKEAHTSSSVEIMQQSSWTTEPFKTDYSIQFPAGYVGLMQGFEGNLFSKHNNDSTYIWYAFITPLYCFDFRDTLSNPYQPAVSVLWYNNQSPFTFFNRVEFTKNGELIGVLYHNNQTYLRGTLFWKDNGYFKEAANVSCWFQNFGEVIDIVRTIKER